MFAIINDLLIESEKNALNREEMPNKLTIPSKIIILNKTNEYIRAMPNSINTLVLDWNSVLNSSRENGKEFKEPDFNVDEDLATLPFSSGTTGLPKGVMITHRSTTTWFCQFRYNLIILTNYIFIILTFHNYYREWALERDENDVSFGLMPLYHQAGWLRALGVLCLGAKLVTMAKFSFSGMLQAIQDHKVSIQSKYNYLHFKTNFT